MKTTIKQCKCVSEFQDKLYGKNNRVHNLSENASKCKCTVCGNVIKS